MKSKIELRQFAVSSALNLDDVTSETVISTAKEIEEYILGSADLPESYDDFSQLDRMKDLLSRGIAGSTNNPTTDEKVIEKGAEEEQTKVYDME